MALITAEEQFRQQLEAQTCAEQAQSRTSIVVLWGSMDSHQRTSIIALDAHRVISSVIRLFLLCGVLIILLRWLFCSDFSSTS